LLGAVFAFELIAVTLWLDNAALTGRSGLTAFIGVWGAWILRGVVAFALFFPTFSWLKSRQDNAGIPFAIGDSRFDWPFFAVHAASFCGFLALSGFLYRTSPSPVISDVAALLWLAAGLCAIVFGGFSLIRPASWLRIVRGNGAIWIVAVPVVLIACILGNSSRDLWPRAAGITLRLTAWMLRPFIPRLIVDPSRMMIGNPKFSVEIAPQCSGLEGIGLILAFGVAWLILFRKTCRFPQALLLLPAGVVLIFLLNSVRIAVLVMIGVAGAEGIATGGFHSQAGWIIFNLVALGFTVGSSRLPWISNDAEKPRGTAVENPTAAWLTPLVAILAAGMVSHALSGGFEWLYPLRFVAAVVALAAFRRTYATVEWRIDWSGPAIGVLVFALWIGFDRFLSPAASSMPEPLAAAMPALRDGWLLVRVLAATVTVPIAEELAFRGYLYRRLLAEDFEAVSLGRFSWLAFAISSVIFGLPHGPRWFAGALAGGLYALAMLRRGSIGNAIAAHAVTNALIAADVLLLGNWNLW